MGLRLPPNRYPITMQNSGKKLVLILVAGALLLGSSSWWYRYVAAHRASQFWGAEASRLIAESEGLEGMKFDPVATGALVKVTSGSLGDFADLSKARGQAHLRHALLSDRNYLWDEPIDAGAPAWGWCFRFHEGERDVYVVISADLQAIGKFQPTTNSVSGYVCEPMTASLKQYFAALPLSESPQADASTPEEAIAE